MSKVKKTTDAYAGWKGKLGRTFAGSDPWWPNQPLAAEGAPNILVILVDDLGYSDLGCYGGEIQTPNVDNLSEQGLRYTNFHVNPMCSPTRASLLTGLNAHNAGVGHVAHSDSGFPGYAMELTKHCATAAEVFRDTGYSTMAIGKWHLCKDSDKHASANRHSWPLQRGFDQFYGILGGFTNFHHPDRLIEGNSFLDIEQYPDGYYLTDDLTNRAISMLKESKTSNPQKPFFMYLAHPAVHAPLQAKDSDLAKYKGKYAKGWDEARSNRFERQKELGIVSQNTVLPPRNPEENNDVQAWDDLDSKTQKLNARYMEIYAAMVDNLDQNIGRVLKTLDDMGELENTIILFTSDNGASREGEAEGCSQYFERLSPSQELALERDFERIDKMGGPETLPHYPRGWAMVGNTPFRLYKCNTHAGGHSVPMILSWPKAGIPKNEMRRQYLHVTDVLPTLCELTKTAIPAERNGLPLKPQEGASFVNTIFNESSASNHTFQVYENQGHRGIYREGMELVALHHPLTSFADSEWELFDLNADPTECSNLAEDKPELVKDLAKQWHEAAMAGQIYPLDEGAWVKWQLRPPSNKIYHQSVTVDPNTPSLEHWRSGELVHMRSFEIKILLDFKKGDHGTLVSHGDQGGGYGVYIENDELIYIHNGYGTMQTLSAGKLKTGVKEIVAGFEAQKNRVWDVKLLVDGEEKAKESGFVMLLAAAPFQGIDVGIDKRSPVSWKIHQKHGTFKYTGKLHSATWTSGEYGPDGGGEELMKMLRELGQRFE